MSGSRSTAAELAGKLLSGRTGRAFWRSLDELARMPEFDAALSLEFPGLASPASAIDRRSVLRVMAASLALAGLTGCDGGADETALPYVRQPEGELPGKARWYATAVTLGGIAQPAVGRTYAGRPVKLEGNSDHPATAGATDPFLQAALLGLYDPERSQTPRHLGRPVAWQRIEGTLAPEIAELDRRGGAGFRLVMGSVTSPTLARQLAALAARWPESRWHAFEPLEDRARHKATARILGADLDQHLRLDRAEVVVSLDEDFLGPGPAQAVLARRWATRRLAFHRGDGDCRLFLAEAVPSLTGTVASERLIVAPSRIGLLAQAIALALDLEGVGPPDLTESEARWVAGAAGALRSHPRRALLTVGRSQPPEVRMLALLANERLEAFGETLAFTAPIGVAPPDGDRSFEALVGDMADGRVSHLAIVGTNPAYAAPADSAFREALARVPFRLHAGLHHDETAARCQWHLPLAHELEAWSDARACDGTVSIIQPLIRPFYAVRPLHSVVEGLAGTGGGASDREIVRDTWRAAWGDGLESRWRDALALGFVAGTAAAPVPPVVVSRAVPAISARPGDGLTVVFQPDPTIWDGRFAGNAWLQETPKPLTKVTWRNVIAVSPALAARRGFTTGDEATLTLAGRQVTGALWITPGQEPGTVAVAFGYGRRRAGELARGQGYDAFAIRATGDLWWAAGGDLATTGRRRTIATTQAHQSMEGFDFVRIVPRPDDAPAGTETNDPPSFYPDRHWESPSWGMAIDLDLCIGCNACVVACMAENNVPVVGEELVAQGREMHWLRVDRYYEGDPSAPRSHWQPVPCMHCEQAPCEMGCPVNAAVHSTDGLNLQVYNRCIGTRTCSSYCPYKVRRFNWFDYSADDPPEMRAARNPEVTVRSRGVMEKCTYCIQHISEARIAAKKEGRALRDGDVVTACQQACPTQAIVFGDVTDAESSVSRWKASARNYRLLPEANTRPRTTYLARIDEADGGPAAERR